MKLYYSLASPYARKPRVIARELGLKIEEIDTKARGNPEFRKVNPMGKIPALMLDDGSVLFDSAVICEYLNHTGGGKFYPGMSIWRQNSGRWKALTLAALGDGLMDIAVEYVHEVRLRPAELQSKDVIAHVESQVRTTIDALEKVKFAADPTIGEIAVGCALGFLDFRMGHMEWRKDHPRLTEWFETILAISIHAGDSAEMKIGGKHTRSIWPIGEDAFGIIDQTKLPHVFVTLTLRDANDAAHAIKSMQTRGAPLIGAVGAYGLALEMRRDPSDENLHRLHDMLAQTRPTAINLRWALGRMRDALLNRPHADRAALAWKEAAAIADEDEAMSRAIGEHGLKIIREIAAKKPGKKLNILTHCNAGWLATVDYGTALAPIYLAHDAGIDLHVWVDETRPRNQGASLTAFELGSHGVGHTIIADNAGGHYMQAGQVDMVIVGTDRVTANGDVANKIGTYLKALAAKDNGVPFYVALPSSTIDWSIAEGRDIPIEEREQDEVLKMSGRLPDGSVALVEIAAPGSGAANPGFDVTPARLVTGLITERGTCAATPEGLRSLFPKT